MTTTKMTTKMTTESFSDSRLKTIEVGDVILAHTFSHIFDNGQIRLEMGTGPPPFLQALYIEPIARLDYYEDTGVIECELESGHIITGDGFGWHTRIFLLSK